MNGRAAELTLAGPLSTVFLNYMILRGKNL